MIRWISDRLGTAPALSPEIAPGMARLDVRDLVDKFGNDTAAVRAKIDQGVALLASGMPLVVCCDYGISRSNAIAAGILAVSEGVALPEAVRRVMAATGETEIKLEPLDVVRRALSGGESTRRSGGSRVLLTGGSGFVGQRLQTALAGRVETVVAAGSEIDLTAGATALGLLAQEYEVDQIVHLANPRVYTSNRAMGDTLTMLRNVLDVCRVSRARLVFVSSWEVYSGYRAAELLADEATPHLPKGPYAEAKLLAEALIAHHRARHDLDVTIVRSAPAFGVGSDKPKFLHNFARAAQAGQGPIRTHRYANGDPKLDLLHIDDLVAALAAVVATRSAGDFNIGGGRLWGTAEIARHMVELAGRDIAVEQQVVQDDVGNILMDSSRAREVLAWVPRHTLEDFLADLMGSGR